MKLFLGRSSAAVVAVVKLKTASDEGQRVSHPGSIRAGSTQRTTPCRGSPIGASRAPPQLLPSSPPPPFLRKEGRGPRPPPKETAELPARPPPTSLGPASRRGAREDNAHPESPPGRRRSREQPHLRGPSPTPRRPRLRPALPRIPDCAPAPPAPSSSSGP